MKKHIMFLHEWKAIDHTIILHLAIFRILFWCRLMNIFLTQLLTEKLLIHKPQPRPMCKFVFGVQKFENGYIRCNCHSKLSQNNFKSDDKFG